MSADVDTARKRPSPLEAIQEALERLPRPSALDFSGKDEVSKGMITYYAAHKVISHAIIAGTHKVDGAAIGLVRDALNANLGKEFNPLWTVFDNLEYAPPARARGQEV